MIIASSSHQTLVANSQMEYDLCRRLQTLTLDGRWTTGILVSRGVMGRMKVPLEIDIPSSIFHLWRKVEDKSDTRSIMPVPVSAGASDTHMLDDTSSQPQKPAETDCSSKSSSTSVVYYGCAYLQAVQAQLEWFPTTGGEYLEAVFTHREVFRARPPAHHFCARGFSDLAMALERRPGRADRDSDTEAAAVFHHEARVIASSL